MIQNLYLGTTSTLKRKAVENVLRILQGKHILPNVAILCRSVESNVPATPHDEDTFYGAKNRAKAVYTRYREEGNLFVGLESGLIKRHGLWFEECWCFIINRHGGQYSGYSSGLLLPNHILAALKAGNKHIAIIEAMARSVGTSPRDTWAVYTKRALSRLVSIEEAFRNALTSLISDLPPVGPH